MKEGDRIMPRTITVKGIGKVSAAPDFVVLSMGLESQDMDYEKAMNIASENIDNLNAALEQVGFEKKLVKTTNFNVHTDYEYRRRKDGSNERVFNGYVVSHNLKVEFDFDSKRLAKALSAVGSCLADPQLSRAFTVKDATAINEEMLRSATANAKRKAEILCDASGMELGTLLSIDYNWGELNVYSNTRYDMEEECLAAPMMAKCAEIDMEPDDIDVSDTATFVWEIK
jgi:uncharacterized protein YggE